MTPLPPKAPPILQLTTTETAPKDPQDAELLTNSAGFTVQQLDDPDAPAELLPIARSYATEKLSYEVLPELKALHQRGALYTHPFIRYYQLKKVIDEIEQTTRKE